jgi:polysaccharide biosynthesis protein PslE
MERVREMNPRSSIRENFVSISLRDLAAPLFRRKRAMITTFLAVLIAGILAGIMVPPEFTSHMAILVNRERVDPLVTTESTTQLVATSNPVSEEEINSEAELLKSSDVLEQVVIANGLEKQHGKSFLDLFRPKQDEADRVEWAVRSLAKKIKVDAPPKTNMIEITYGSSNPRLSYGVLKTLGNLYMEKHVAVHRPPGSYEFFAQQTQKYQQALKDSEARLRSFGEQQGAAAPDLERTDLAVQVTNSVGQMHSTEQAIAADEQRIRSDQEQMQVTPQRSATKQDTDAANLLLQNLGTSLLAAETKRTQLLLKYDPSYPLVKEADQEVAEAKAAIAEAEKTPYINQETDRDPTFELLREDRARTEADLAAQGASLAAVKHSIQSLQTQMADLDQKSVTQQDLEREVKANEDNYLLYLSKREQERTSDALDKTRIANVAIAVPPAIPALPAHGFPFTVLIALGFATLLSIAMAYIMEYFDSSFHTPAQVIDMLGIPVVVAVPKRTA